MAIIGRPKFGRTVSVLRRHFRDIAARAGKTFAQAFFAAFVVPQAGVFTLAAWKGAVVAALAAAASAVWNVIRNYRYEKAARQLERAWRAENPELAWVLDSAQEEAASRKVVPDAEREADAR